MDKHQRQDELCFLMQKHRLTAKQVAEMCNVNVGTVYGWTTFNMARSIPEKHLTTIKDSLI